MNGYFPQPFILAFITMPSKGSRKRAGTIMAPKPPAKKTKSTKPDTQKAACQHAPSVEHVEDKDDSDQSQWKHPRKDRKSTRLNSSHITPSRMPSSA